MSTFNDRFTTKMVPNRGAVTVTDKQTKKKVVVALCDLQGFKKAMNFWLQSDTGSKFIPTRAFREFMVSKGYKVNAIYNEARKNGKRTIKVATGGVNMTESHMQELNELFYANGYDIMSFKPVSRGKWTSPWFSGPRIFYKKMG